MKSKNKVIDEPIKIDIASFWSERLVRKFVEVAIKKHQSKREKS